MTWFILVPIAIGLGLTGLAAFFWALRSGQFSDPEGDACRILIPQPPAKGDTHVRLASQPDHEDPDRGL